MEWLRKIKKYSFKVATRLESPEVLDINQAVLLGCNTNTTR
jgi:hypothetical protein